MRYPSFSAPSANEAYRDAPSLDAEASTVLELLLDLNADHRPDFFPPVSAAERREALLRAAALTDRFCWDKPTEEAHWAADRAADVLMEHDRQDPSGIAGSIGPKSIEWDAPGGARAYTRQEYLSWLTGPHGEDCNNCQGETCRRCGATETN